MDAPFNAFTIENDPFPVKLHLHSIRFLNTQMICHFCNNNLDKSLKIMFWKIVVLPQVECLHTECLWFDW